MQARDFHVAFRRGIRTLAMRVLWLAVVIGLLGTAYIWVERTIQEGKDFGSHILIRQISSTREVPVEFEKLRRETIVDFVTSRKRLKFIGDQFNWQIPYDEKVARIEVRTRLSEENSFILSVQTGDFVKSMQVSGVLGNQFWREYNKTLIAQIAKALDESRVLIEDLKVEIAVLEVQLNRAIARNSAGVHGEGANFLNKQLELNETRFLLAYSTYVGRFDKMCDELEIELNLALQVYTEKHSEVQRIRAKLAEAKRLQATLQREFVEKSPDIYSHDFGLVDLEGLPNDIIWLYNNIRSINLKRHHQVLREVYDEKSAQLDREIEREQTLEALLVEPLSDVFIRELKH